MVTNPDDMNSFLTEVEERKKKVIDYVVNKYQDLFRPPRLHEVIYNAVLGKQVTPHEVWHSYILRGGKALRPAVLTFSCGLVGGEEQIAIPAAAAVEVWHTFTLVHDDILDRDPLRRHEKTVHEFYREVGRLRGMPEDEAKHYGICIGIVAGDLLDGWAKLLLDDLYVEKGLDAETVLALIRELEGNVTLALATGQTKDVYFETQPIRETPVRAIVEMLQQKTAALYEFAGRAGAMIGLNTSDRNHKIVRLIADITYKCGTAFQLQDDILGIVGKSEITGKPVGSDIIQGKRTTIVRYAWENADAYQREKLQHLLSLREKMTKEQLQEVTKLLIDLGGVDKTKKLAQNFAHEAAKMLEKIPRNIKSSEYTKLFGSWIDFMVNRDF